MLHFTLKDCHFCILRYLWLEENFLVIQHTTWMSNTPQRFLSVSFYHPAPFLRNMLNICLLPQQSPWPGSPYYFCVIQHTSFYLSVPLPWGKQKELHITWENLFSIAIFSTETRLATHLKQQNITWTAFTPFQKVC